MRALMVGCFLDGTGYARSAIDQALALDASGVDLACRALRLADITHPVPPRLEELLRKPCPAGEWEVLIQHTLPVFFERRGEILCNVGMFHPETSHFRGTGWQHRLNLLDGVIVASTHGAEACRRSGVTVPIQVVPQACDTDWLTGEHDPLSQLASLKREGKFLFYTVGEAIRRKNLGGLFKAYLTEFFPWEGVHLVIKTSRPGMSEPDLRSFLTQMAQEGAVGLKVPDFRRGSITFLTERFSDEQMARLHATGDVFVQTSFGEGWSLPAQMALGMGKTPIVPDSTAYREYVDDSVGWLIPTVSEPCFGDESHPDLYRGEEEWESVSILGLRRALREAFTQHVLRQEKARRGRERIERFSYPCVGALLVEALNHVQKTIRWVQSPLRSVPMD